jgi:probable addiction module antidote protein
MRTIETRPFDAAVYLKTDEDIVAYLDEAMETGDADYIIHALGIIARAKGMSAIAKESGLRRETLYKAFGEQGNPEFATILKFLNALGLTLHVSKAPVTVSNA